MAGNVETHRVAAVAIWVLTAFGFIWGVVCLFWIGGLAGAGLLVFNWAFAAWNTSRALDLHGFMWHGRLD